MSFGQPHARTLLLFVGPVIVFLMALMRLGVATSVPETVARWDRMAKRQPWDVVVVGASFARTDIDDSVLAEKLGARQDAGLVIVATSSSAPVWYAILKERVYGNGLSPKYVVLPATIWTLLTNRLPPAELREVLDQMPAPDEVVTRRSLDDRVPALLQRFSQRRADLRDPLLDAFRNLLPRLLLGVDAAGVEAAGAAVFGEHHAGAGARAIPTVEHGAEVGPVSDYLASDPEESYLADIAALVNANGGQLVIVLPPFLRLPPGAPDVGRSLDGPLRAWANSAEVTLLDFRGLGWDSSRYTDALHLRPEAARELTESAAEAILSGSGVGSETDRSRVERTGAPPKLPALVERPGKDPCLVTAAVRPYAFLGTKGIEERFPDLPSPLTVWEGDTQLRTPLRKGKCTGTAALGQTLRASRVRADGPPLQLRWSDAVPDVAPNGWRTYWVYPGTSLTWTVEHAAADTCASARVAARVALFGEGTGAPEISVAEFTQSLTVAAGEGTADVTTEAAPRQITLRSPPDGPFLLVTELIVELDGEAQSLVVPPPARQLHILDAGQLTAAAPPPAPPPMPVRERGDKHWFAVPWNSRTPCSPLRVSGPDGPLPARATAKAGISKGTWQLRDRLEFLAESGRNPQSDYQVTFAPDRECPRSCKACGDRAWVYPGDTVRVVVPPEPRRKVAESFASLRVTTWIDAPVVAESALRVLVRHGTALLADRGIQVAELNGSVVLPFASPAGAADDLTVELLSEGNLPATLVLATLQDR